MVEAASSGIDRSRQELIAQVVDAYLRVVGEREVLAAHDSRNAALDSQLTHAGLRREVGRAADVEVLRLEAAVAAAQADRVTHRTGLATAEGDLYRLVGDTGAASAGQLMTIRLLHASRPDRETVVKAARAANPDLIAAGKQRDAAIAARAIARGSRWPELKAIGSYVDYGDSDGDHTAEWNAGVVLSWPLFTGGANAGALSRADANARAVSEQVDLKDLEVRAAADRALSAIDEADARVAALERAVASQTEVVRIERLSIETGSGTQTDYLAAEAGLLSAQAGLIEARHAAINARVALARLTGILEEEWISSNLESES
jgi:outer membrane protein TolC